MTIEELSLLLAPERIEDLVQSVAFDRIIYYGDQQKSVEDIIKEYNPFAHKVMQRADDLSLTPTGERFTDFITGREVEEKVVSETPLNKLPLSYQQKITNQAVAFAVGEGIKLQSSPQGKDEENLFELIKIVWDDTKINHKTAELLRLKKSETHCAEMWWDDIEKGFWDGTPLEGKSDRRPGVTILAESLGHKLYPVFDERGKMIAFGYQWVTENKLQETKTVKFTLWTESVKYTAERVDGIWSKPVVSTNTYGFLPFIYHSQPLPEWANAQYLIERKEEKLCSLGDSNDIFEFPALVGDSNIIKDPYGSKTDKYFQIDQGSTLTYLTKDTQPDSTKYEMDLLSKEIHSQTQTADISFDSIKGLIGTAVSGISLKMLFLDPQLKAATEQAVLGEMIQRRINIIKKILININADLNKARRVQVSAIMKPFMPVNEVELNSMLIEAYQGGMISQRTMMEKSSLVEDPDSELEEIKKQAPVDKAQDKVGFSVGSDKSK